MRSEDTRAECSIDLSYMKGWHRVVDYTTGTVQSVIVLSLYNYFKGRNIILRNHIFSQKNHL